MKNSGIGVGLPDTGRIILEVRDGKVRIRTGAACIGQGMATMATQVLCETTGLTADKVFVERPDTVRTQTLVQLLHLVKQYSLVKQLAKQVFA